MKRLAMSVAVGGLLFVGPLFAAGPAFAASSPMTHAATTKAAVHKTVTTKPAVHKTVHRTVVHRTVVTRTIALPAVVVLVRAAVGLLVPLFVGALIGVTIVL